MRIEVQVGHKKNKAKNNLTDIYEALLNWDSESRTD